MSEMSAREQFNAGMVFARRDQTFWQKLVSLWCWHWSTLDNPRGWRICLVCHQIWIERIHVSMPPRWNGEEQG